MTKDEIRNRIEEIREELKVNSLWDTRSLTPKEYDKRFDRRITLQTERVRLLRKLELFT